MDNPEDQIPMISRRTLVTFAPAVIAVLLAGCSGSGGDDAIGAGTSDQSTVGGGSKGDAELLGLVGTWSITDGASITTGSADASLRIEADGSWSWNVNNDGEIDAYSGAWKFDSDGALQIDLLENDSTSPGDHHDGFGAEQTYTPLIANLDDIGPAFREILLTDDLDRQQELLPQLLDARAPFTALNQARVQAFLSLDWDGRPKDNLTGAVVEPSEGVVRVWFDRDLERFAEDPAAPPTLTYTRV